ncbi:hypothetical protein FGG08_001247 [Glutinoglossum americanum]|uniref:SAP domain-containing protein n=1 Tax=Glutinoglossum americanum TaxID=1670608 RepID=A0A9P8IH33_9PEZI|nr:hypothetical protein FGG08_001247 [Glutinoglossum americanum]
MTNYSDLKVVELKAELKKRGLPQTGLKQILVERLEAAENEASKLRDPHSLLETAASEPAEAHLAIDTIAPTTSVATEPEARNPDDGSTALELRESDERPIISEETVKDVDSSTMDEADGPIPKSMTSSEAADTPMIDSPQTLVQSPGTGEILESNRLDDESAIVSGDHLGEHRGQDTETPTKRQEELSMMKDDDSVNEGASMQPCGAKSPVADDARKRKRWSQSPPTSGAEIAKKARLEGASVALLGELKPTDEPNGVDMCPSVGGAMDISIAEAELTAVRPEEAGNTREGEALRSPTPPHSPLAPKRTVSNNKGGRFKDLFSSAGGVDKEFSRGRSPNNRPSDHEIDDGEDHDITPALHSATSALYIRNFMRPLHPPSLKEHLISLATPPSSSPNPEILGDFYLDPIRTHCLAVFANIAAASRVRSALHNRVWPNERTRKPLWADFVPENKVRDWIELEQSTAGSGARNADRKRWEVVYETVGGEEGYHNVQAVLREVGAGGQAQNSSGGIHGMQGVPLGPRGSAFAFTGSRHAGLSQAAMTASRPANSGFSALDSLFKSTAAKPKLYFLPVSKELAERRLGMLADARRSRGRGSRSRGGGRLHNEQRRYTFEDGDLLVDGGPDLRAGWRGGGSDNYSGGGRPRVQYAPRLHLEDRRGRW